MTVCMRSALFFAIVAGLVAGARTASAQSVSYGADTMSYEARKPKAQPRSQSEASRSRSDDDVEPAAYYDEDNAPQHRSSNPPSNVRRNTPTKARPAATARRIADEEDVGPRQMPAPTQSHRSITQEMSDYGDHDSGQCCGNGGDFNDMFYSTRRGSWFIGAELLYIRPHFSEAVSYVDKKITMDENENLTDTDTSIEYNFRYEPTAKVYIGYRLCDCGGEIQFSFWHFNIHDAKATGAVPDDLSEIFGGQLENNAGVPGDRLFDDFGMNINTYDIDFAKRVPLGCCDNCCCAPWELKYSVGVRVADVHRTHNNLVTDIDGAAVSSGEITADFTGAGPKVGLEMRRYFQSCRCWSLYAASDFALLLGKYDVNRTRRTPPTDSVTTTVQIDDVTRLVPVAEIETGLSWQMFRHTLVSVGWQFQAWWDLGMFESIQGSNFGPMDDSNIMSFDGGFLRVEMTF